MPLRCLIFSSDEPSIQPILEVLAGLGVQAEHCKDAVDAVEKVTTHLFQIVITDWQDQPEASFLLKTARDLRAAVRPLTLAIVTEEGRPLALQAGANSILLRPVRSEQVRETMSTACQLLQSKLQAVTQASPRTAGINASIGAVSAGAVSASAAAAAPAPASAPVAQTPEKLRAGDFLQSARTAPGTQFETEKDVRGNMEASAGEVTPLTELEPMAAAVQDSPETKPEPEAPLSGWAALQARLTKSAPLVPKDAAAQNEATSSAEAENTGPVSTQGPVAPYTSSDVSTGASSGDDPEAALFDYIEGESKGQKSKIAEDKTDSSMAAAGPRSKAAKLVLAGIVVFAIAIVTAVPRARQRGYSLYRNGMHAGVRWLNPPPATLPPTVTQHDSFGQPDDEYKFPATGNIPDSTTDPSQIQVVPVIDPTAKPEKHTDSGAGSQQSPSGDQMQGAPTAAPSDQNLPSGAQSVQSSGVNPQITNAVPPGSNTPSSSSTPIATPPPSLPKLPVPQLTPVQAAPVPAPPASLTVPQPAPSSNAVPIRTATAQSVSTAVNAGIPASLKSFTASTTPDLSGAKPVDAAMSSIEPVKLPESAVREQLFQGSDPEYPASAKSSGQSGSVVLQVLIGRDGTVQDAKFLQGSFMFARTAIDAVRQWRFKPYSMNGHAVSVQGVITLNFKPPSS